jgi:REP element-mobilizing transposase RayT
MAHSYSRNHIPLIFSTKERRNTISKELQPRLWAYIAGICKNYEMIAVAIVGTENHVHILFHLTPKLALVKAVQLIKGNSSKWIGEQGIDFTWQEGTQPSASVLQTSIRSHDMFTTKRRIIENSASRTNFEPSSRNTAWNTTRITYLVSDAFEMECATPPGLSISSLLAPTALAVGYDLSSLTGLTLRIK